MSEKEKKPEKKTLELLEKEKEILTTEKEYIKKINEELNELNPVPPKSAPTKIEAPKTEIPKAEPPKVIIATEEDLQKNKAESKQNLQSATAGEAIVWAIMLLLFSAFIGLIAWLIMDDHKRQEDRINAKATAEMPTLSIEKAVDIYDIAKDNYYYPAIIEEVFEEEKVIKIYYRGKGIFIHVDAETYKLIAAHKDSHDLIEIKNIKDKMYKK